MANHVDNYIQVQGNDAVKAEWETLFIKYGEKIERPSYHGDGTIEIWEYHEIQKHPFLSGYTEDNWYDWGCENIGAKWAHIEYADEGMVNITSAWSAITPYVEELYFYLKEIDEDVIIEHRYEDEFRNFVGVVSWADDCTDEVSLDDEDIQEMMERKFGKRYWEADDWDWSDYHEKAECVPDEYQDSLIYTFFEENGATWH
jgi:hypothetical protein